MTEHSPITPPPELVQQWEQDWHHSKVKHVELMPYIAARAAQWGADQELEACCELLDNLGGDGEMIRRYRRPKPLSLKQQALQELDKVDMLWCTEDFDQVSQKALETIRKALEALPDD